MKYWNDELRSEPHTWNDISNDVVYSNVYTPTHLLNKSTRDFDTW